MNKMMKEKCLKIKIFVYSILASYPLKLFSQRSKNMNSLLLFLVDLDTG